MGPGGGRRGGPGGGGPMGAMGRPVEKAKNFRGTLRRLMKYLLEFKVTFIAVFILAIGSTAFSIIGPKILGYATTKLGDGIIAQYTHFIEVQTAILRHMPSDVIARLQMQPIPKFDFAYIGENIVILLVLYVLSSTLSFMMGFLMSTVSQKVVFRMRNDVKEKLDRLPLKYFDEHTHGEILSRVTNDMDNIATTLQQSLGQLITSLVTIIGAMVMMISISPLMTLIALVTLPLSAVITMRIAKASQKYYADQQKILGQLNGHVEEMYTGHKIIKVTAREKQTIREFKKINAELYTASNKAQFMTGIIMPVLTFVNNIGYVAVCIVGGYQVAKNAIKIGDVQAFIQYIRTFTFPIIQTANIINVIQSTIASAERVFEVLDEGEQVPDREDAIDIANPRGEVLFDHVNFSYKEDAPLIEDMNMHVKQGDTIAIVGPTGAGKTTLVNLLMRFYEIKGGCISIDGVDIRDMERGSLRQMFGMVLQDTWLFNGTIRDNIAYGRDNVREEDIIAAAKAAHADHFISSLPDGYKTILNEEASNISQGQKQLITIARAILADPAILILDEATSNVDTRSEVLIQKAMAKLMEGRTSFVIAHRLSTIRDANTILVMNKGSIIEQGNHKQLLAQKGFYADLYNSQFSGAFIE
ncbi:MAG: ABC transporter ATP-binding protein [Eubacteriales bacterium]